MSQTRKTNHEMKTEMVVDVWMKEVESRTAEVHDDRVCQG